MSEEQAAYDQWLAGQDHARTERYLEGAERINERMGERMDRLERWGEKAVVMLDLLQRGVASGYDRPTFDALMSEAPRLFPNAFAVASVVPRTEDNPQ